MEKEGEFQHQGEHHQVCHGTGTLSFLLGMSIQEHSDFVNRHSFMTRTPTFSQLAFLAAIYSVHQLYALGNLENRD